jgi:hypothetical protein
MRLNKKQGRRRRRRVVVVPQVCGCVQRVLSGSLVRLVPRLPLYFVLILIFAFSLLAISYSIFADIKRVAPRGVFSVGMSPYCSRRNLVREPSVRELSALALEVVQVVR